MKTESLQHKPPQTVPWTGARAVTLVNTITLAPKGRPGLPELPGFLGDYSSGLGKTGSPDTAWAEHQVDLQETCILQPSVPLTSLVALHFSAPSGNDHTDPIHHEDQSLWDAESEL